MRMRMLAAVLVLGSVGAAARAQMGGMASPAVGSQTTPSKSADALLRIFEGECLGAAKAMPAEKYNFSPASLKIAGAKYDGVRTFADEVKHLAQANYFFGISASGMKPDVDMKGLTELKSKDEIVAALTASFAFLHKTNGMLTTENAFEVVDFEGAKATRSMVAAFAVAHGFDHYGQMVEYLRMNGIVPPASAK